MAWKPGCESSLKFVSEGNIMKMKYIIIDSVLCGEYPILFPDHITHADMARKFVNSKIISAGEVIVHGEDLWIETEGKSLSLGLNSREKDEKIIKRGFSL